MAAKRIPIEDLPVVIRWVAPPADHSWAATHRALARIGARHLAKKLMAETPAPSQSERTAVAALLIP